LTNRLSEPITIVDIHASCGCTRGRANTRTIAPGQKALVEAEMDTRNFVGRKETTLYVTLMTAGGKESEIRLGVSSTILSDIVLNPGTIDFGSVEKGQTPQKSLTLDRLDAPNWKVERMLSSCRSISAGMVETARNGSTVSYLLTVSLKPEAPAGNLRDEILVVTNDPESPHIPIQVTAQIRGDLSATPSVLGLGHVASASVAQGRFLIRGSKPFTIVSIAGAGEGFKLAADDSTPKSMHILTLSYYPAESSIRGDLRRTFRVVTDLPGEPPVDLTATLHVDP
jgi:uncharacterized protein DUF1573